MYAAPVADLIAAVLAILFVRAELREQASLVEADELSEPV